MQIRGDCKQAGYTHGTKQTERCLLSCCHLSSETMLNMRIRPPNRGTIICTTTIPHRRKKRQRCLSCTRALAAESAGKHIARHLFGTALFARVSRQAQSPRCALQLQNTVFVPSVYGTSRFSANVLYTVYTGRLCLNGPNRQRNTI